MKTKVAIIGSGNIGADRMTRLGVATTAGEPGGLVAIPKFREIAIVDVALDMVKQKEFAHG